MHKAVIVHASSGTLTCCSIGMGQAQTMGPVAKPRHTCEALGATGVAAGPLHKTSENPPPPPPAVANNCSDIAKAFTSLNTWMATATKPLATRIALACFDDCPISGLVLLWSNTAAKPPGLKLTMTSAKKCFPPSLSSQSSNLTYDYLLFIDQGNVS